MQFKVNYGVVKMIEILSKSKSLQIIFLAAILILKLADIITAIRWW